MALNANHTFEDLDGIKCSIVEKKCTAERKIFIEDLLKGNGYKVIAVATEDTFTIGVTDVSFNLMNAIYNRELKDAKGNVIGIKYWKSTGTGVENGEWYWVR